MGLIERLRQGLSRAREQLGNGLGALLKPGASLGPDEAEALEAALLAADLGPELSAACLEALKKRFGSGQAPQQLLRAILLEQLTGYGLSKSDILSAPPIGKPEVTLAVGVNGSGKTTTCGKLAAHWTGAGQKVVLAAGDTFRAAAAEQLAVWAQRSGAELIRQKEGADPSAVAFDAITHARVHGLDRVIIDTAGRLQTKVNLMEELRKVQRVCAKALPGAPQRVLLVLDGTSGQNMLSQARLFAECVEVTAVAVTKLDGSARAGGLLRVARDLRLPVQLVGVGEALEDLQAFDPEAYVAALVS